MSDLEKTLAAQSMRAAPAEWRGEILRTARAEVHVQEATLWRRLLFGWRPAALGAAWLLVAVLHFTTPREPRPSSAAASAIALQQQAEAMQRLLAEQQPQAAPRKPAPVKPQSFVPGRRPGTVACSHPALCAAS